MSHELYYTSVPPGLIPGVKGYSTVAHTAEIPSRIMLLLEQSLSDYRYSAEGNPPAVWSHLRVREGLRELSVLSRKTPVPDHSGRPSVFAHHVVLGPDEQPEGGPAWVLGQGQDETDGAAFLLPLWDGQIGTLRAGRRPRDGDRPPARCTAWESAGLDPGWAGVLAEAFLTAPDRPSFLICRPDRDLLPLLEDAIALLPVSRRWSLTFSTYFTGLPPNVPCAWRGVLADSAEARQAVRLGRGLVIDLDAAGEPKGDALVELARTGNRAARTVVRPQPSAAPTRWVSSSRLHLPTVEEQPVPLAAPSLPAYTRRKQRGPSTPMIVGVAASVLLLAGMTVYVATQGDPSVEPPDLPTAREVPTPTDRPLPQVEPPRQEVAAPPPPPPRPVAQEKPREVVKKQQAPEREPEVKETRFANITLPNASAVSSRHDDRDTPLAVKFPQARRYSLTLRGQNDREVQAQQLRVRPTRPGLTDSLTVFNETVKPGGNKRKQFDSRELARFWIDKDRLHFQWVEKKLDRTQEDSSLALRECLLVIRGGEVQTKLALRGLVEEPTALTAEIGTRPIPWKPGIDRPEHRVDLLSCQVQRDGKWNDLAETAERNLREWIILPPAEGVEPRLVLRMKLSDNGSEIRSSLEPSIRQLDRSIKDLALQGRKQHEVVEVLDKTLSHSRIELHELQKALIKADKTLNHALANIDVVRAEVRQFYSRFLKLDDAPQVQSAMQEAEGARNSRDAAAAAFDDCKKRFSELARPLEDAKERLKLIEEALKAERELRKRAESENQAPIRVKLGILIDGEMIEVARIGPW